MTRYESGLWMRRTCATGNIRSLRMCRPLFASSSTWGFHRIVAPEHIDWIRAKHAHTYVHCGPRYSDKQATASCCCFCCSRCRRIALEAGQERQRNGSNSQMKYLVVFPCINSHCSDISMHPLTSLRCTPISLPSCHAPHRADLYEKMSSKESSVCSHQTALVRREIKNK